MKAQRIRWRFMLLPVMAVAGVLFSGCLDDDRFDHQPPANQGSVIIDNRSSSDVNVFIDGASKDRTRARRWRAFDLNPGVHRLVLDERDGDRNFRGDVDVLVQKRTVVEITNDPAIRNRFSVFIYFD